MTPEFRAGMIKAADLCEKRVAEIDAERLALNPSNIADKIDLLTAASATRAMCIEILTACEEPAKDAT